MDFLDIAKLIVEKGTKARKIRAILEEEIIYVQLTTESYKELVLMDEEIPSAIPEIEIALRQRAEELENSIEELRKAIQPGYFDEGRAEE